VTLRNASNWTRVKNHIKLWDNLKKKEITVTIKVNWGWKSIADYTTEKKKKKKKEKKKKNKPKC